MDSFECFCSWLGSQFEELSPAAFYRSLFGSGALQSRSSQRDGKGKIVAVEVPDEGRPFRHLIPDELDNLEEVLSTDNFLITSPISYVGKNRCDSNAVELFAIAFDLDDVLIDDATGVPEGLVSIFMRAEKGFIPTPSYVVSSGTGLHLYFKLDKPLHLYPDRFEALGKFRENMTRKIWDKYSSTNPNIQFESVTQAFKMVGSSILDGTGRRVRAFRTGGSYSIDELNDYVQPSSQIFFGYQSALPLEKAKRLYPEWYQKVVVEGRPADGTWTCSEAVYEWWLEKARYVEVGHRYWFLYFMCSYAQKCGIPYDRLEADALKVREMLDFSHLDPFTLKDVYSALEAFNRPMKLYPIEKIEYFTGIEIPRNKRNGRSRTAHLAHARLDLAEKYPDGSWREGGNMGKGRPSKEKLIRDYAAEHPDMTQAEIASNLDVSPTTVNKWLKKKSKKELDQQ